MLVLALALSACAPAPEPEPAPAPEPAIEPAPEPAPEPAAEPEPAAAPAIATETVQPLVSPFGTWRVTAAVPGKVSAIDDPDALVGTGLAVDVSELRTDRRDLPGSDGSARCETSFRLSVVDWAAFRTENGTPAAVPGAASPTALGVATACHPWGALYLVDGRLVSLLDGVYLVLDRDAGALPWTVPGPESFAPELVAQARPAGGSPAVTVTDVDRDDKPDVVALTVDPVAAAGGLARVLVFHGRDDGWELDATAADAPERRQLPDWRSHYVDAVPGGLVVRKFTAE